MAIPFTEAELLQFRADTGGTAERIHFNNAGASLPPDKVVDTMVAYLKEEALSGGYETEAKYQQELENTYHLIARLINADKNEIAITENASIAWGLAFNGIRFSPGDIILTSELEYVTNIMGFLKLEERGVEVKMIANDADGNFPISELEAAISSKTKLIAVTHVASAAGAVLPVEAIGAIAKQHSILYLVDACQSVGQMPVDVKAIHCDMLSATGRKFLRGPRGTGFLYVKSSVQDQLNILFMDGFSAKAVSTTGFELRDDARRFELFEKSRALTLGLGAAVEYALQIGIDRIWMRIQLLSALLRERLQGIQGITVQDRGAVQCGIVTFSVKGITNEQVVNQLRAQRINVFVGSTRSTLYYMEKHQLNAVVRASLHYYNTEAEIAFLGDALQMLTTAGNAPGAHQLF